MRTVDDEMEFLRRAEKWKAAGIALAVALRRCREDSKDLMEGNEAKDEWVMENIKLADEALEAIEELKRGEA
jgi:hypothetical protein